MMHPQLLNAEISVFAWRSLLESWRTSRVRILIFNPGRCTSSAFEQWRESERGTPLAPAE